MKKTKKNVKPLILLFLVIAFSFMMMIPKKVYAGQWPGIMGSGMYGLTCYCPSFWNYNCGCAFKR